MSGINYFHDINLNVEPQINPASSPPQVEAFRRAAEILSRVRVPMGFRRAWVPGLGCRLILMGHARLTRRFRVKLGIAFSPCWPYLE